MQHYIDVIMGTIASQITSLTQPFIQTQIKENIKAPCHWPSCGEFTGDRWIPRHKWPVTRKMFPFDDVIMNGLIPNLRTTITWTSDDQVLWRYMVLICYSFSKSIVTISKTILCYRWQFLSLYDIGKCYIGGVSRVVVTSRDISVDSKWLHVNVVAPCLEI